MNTIDMMDSPDFVKSTHHTSEFTDVFGIPLVLCKQKITFTHNGDRTVHRWSPYIQGFSASFVNKTLSKYKISTNHVVLDPFVGSGTVVTCSQDERNRFDWGRPESVAHIHGRSENEMGHRHERC